MKSADIDIKTWKSVLLIICLLSVFNTFVYSQEEADIAALHELFVPEQHTSDHSKYLENSDSDIRVILSLAFLVYKEFISSQDVNACVFEPSCSEYTIEAIEKYGAFVGILHGFDRLSRCHHFVSRDNYSPIPQTGKYYDPL